MTINHSLNSIQERLTLLDSLDKKLLGEKLERIYNRDKSKRSIFVLLAHEWGNIGDLAISYTQQTFLEKTFPHYPVYTLTRQAVTHNWQRVLQTIQRNDIIVLPGGGNMGDLWLHEEVARRKIVESFPENKIISFPQSIHFDNLTELEKSSKVYNEHKKFLLYTRDDKSYNLAKENFNNIRVERTEDIVTTYVYPFPFLPENNDVLFIKRDDKEKVVNSGLEELETTIKTQFDVRYTDTLVPNLEFSNIELAAKLVYKKIDEIHSSKLVVTDRLHGVIFALLAGKPVIAFDNSYQKISGALKNILPHYSGSLLLVDNGINQVTLDNVIDLVNSGKPILPFTETLKEEHAKLEEQLKTFVYPHHSGITSF